MTSTTNMILSDFIIGYVNGHFLATQLIGSDPITKLLKELPLMANVKDGIDQDNKIQLINPPVNPTIDLSGNADNSVTKVLAEVERYRIAGNESSEIASIIIGQLENLCNVIVRLEGALRKDEAISYRFILEMIIRYMAHIVNLPKPIVFANLKGH